MTPDKRAAWIEALESAYRGVNSADEALLRDLAARLERAHVGVLREEIPGKLVFEPSGAGQRVIVIPDETEQPRPRGWAGGMDPRGDVL